MRVLVTGGAGFFGNNIVRRLTRDGHSVRAMVRDMDKARRRLGNVSGDVEVVTGDVTDRGGLAPLVQGMDAVVHLVAIPMERGGQTYEGVNYQGTVNIVDAAKEAGVTRFLNMAQNGARADHWSPFLRSKGRAAAYVANSGLRYTTFRPSAVFGPQDEFFNAFARLIRLTPVVFPLIGGGKAEFQPVSIDDVAEAVARSLADEGTVGREFALGGPEVLTLGDIERRVLNAMGASRLLVPAPVPLLRPVVALMQRALPNSPVNMNLLDLLKEPNTTPDNHLVTYFHMTPKAFSGDALAYLRTTTARQAIQVLFSRRAVN